MANRNDTETDEGCQLFKDVLLLLQMFSDVVRRLGLSIVRQLIVSVSPRFRFIMDVMMI